jgi:hypothetical protein
MSNAMITIDMDAKCKRCGKKGAMPTGLCLACVTKGIERGDYDHILKKQSFYSGKNAVWHKRGKRYGIAVMIVAVNEQTQVVQVEELQTRKTRFVPSDQLTAK